MNTITIRNVDITALEADAVVNAANDRLRAGSGVCGAIFAAAGEDKLQAACDAIGRCPTGSAVITSGFDLKAKHIIHAVGPIWAGGSRGEPEQLYSAYRSSLELAAENGLHSIGFPLISSGIYGYPKDGAWRQAIRACKDFFLSFPQADMSVIFAVRSDHTLSLGRTILREIAAEYAV